MASFLVFLSLLSVDLHATTGCSPEDLKNLLRVQAQTPYGKIVEQLETISNTSREPKVIHEHLMAVEHSVSHMSDKELIESINNELQYYSAHENGNLPGIELHGETANAKLLVQDLQQLRPVTDKNLYGNLHEHLSTDAKNALQNKGKASLRIWQNFIGNVFQGDLNYFAIKDKEWGDLMWVENQSARSSSTYYLNKEFAQRLAKDRAHILELLDLHGMDAKVLSENLDKILSLF